MTDYGLTNTFPLSMHSFGQLKFFGHKNLIETWQNANK